MRVVNRTSTTSRAASASLSGTALREKTSAGPSAPTSVFDSEDHIEISPEAADFTRIKSIVAAVPDVREDLLSAIKKELDSGKYRPPAELVAEKIIRESLMNAALFV